MTTKGTKALLNELAQAKKDHFEIAQELSREKARRKYLEVKLLFLCDGSLWQSFVRVRDFRKIMSHDLDGIRNERD